MPPFETAFYLPFVVITLAVAVYFTMLISLKPSTEIRLSTYMEQITRKKPPKKQRQTSKVNKSTKPERMNEIEEKACPHYVGYLTTLLKGSPFPEECFGCRKVIQCLRIEPTKVIESFYVGTTDTN